MTIKVYDEPIPENKLHQFHEILCATGGRYISEPFKIGRERIVRVSYEPGDYTAMQKAWRDCTTDINEVNASRFGKVSWWRKPGRRLQAGLKILRAWKLTHTK